MTEEVKLSSSKIMGQNSWEFRISFHSILSSMRDEACKKKLNPPAILNGLIMLIYTQEKLKVINFDINTLPFIHLLIQKKIEMSI